jgi:hypothetical protein
LNVSFTNAEEALEELARKYGNRLRAAFKDDDFGHVLLFLDKGENNS